MSDAELIAKQQHKIKKLKRMLKANKKVRKDLHGMFYSIGEPLNDNILRMTGVQLRWCMEVYRKTEEIQSL